MGKKQQLDIIINGKTKGLKKVGAEIEYLGQQIDTVGSKARSFLSDSEGVYRSYEDNMLAAEYALSAQYESATELGKIMHMLDLYASEWASNSIFHTDDVSKAINEAAHAGWDYTEIIKGIPQAMLIAQAGGLELSTGLDYLTKMMGSTGSSFEDLGTIVDQWSKAANLSKTNIDEMGEAFISMGSSAQFGDSTQELFTLLAVLANVGTTGSQAGTAIRSAMVRIIAPTTKAEAAMSLLGADASEIEEALSDDNVTKAAKTLQGLGFSAYDAEGKLLPIIDIFTNLHDSLQGLDEQSQNEILASIFPTRTIAQAKAFISAVGSGQMQDFFNGIGNSSGYAQSGAEIMMSGLTGAIETFLSKWEEFKKSMGESVAPWIESITDSLGGMIDTLNGLSPEKLSGIAGGLSGIAALGPALMIAGGAIKLFSTLGPVGTKLLVASIAIGAISGYMSKLNEIEFEGKFGDIALDLKTLSDNVDGITTVFSTQAAAIAGWESAVNTAAETYSSKSSKLAEMLLTDVLTGKTLSQAEKDNINAYAEDLYKAVYEGLTTAEARDTSFLAILFGDASGAEEMAAGSTGAQVVDSYYESLYAEAESIGAEIRNKMSEALTGDLNEQERQAIQDSINRYNQIMAEIAGGTETEGYYAQLYKAQTVSWDSISTYMEDNAAKMQSDLAAVSEQYASGYGVYKRAFDYAVEHGTVIKDLNGNERTVTTDDWAEFDSAYRKKEAEARQSVIDKYGSLNYSAVNSLMYGSDYSDFWNFVNFYAQNYTQEGFNENAMFAGMDQAEADKIQSQMNAFLRNRKALNSLRGLFAPFAGDGSLMAVYNDIFSGSLSLADMTSAVDQSYWYSFENKSPLMAVELVPDDTELRAYDPGTIYIPAVLSPTLGTGEGGMDKYAEGGRANTPSIFGEAGPEWAIPEEHSERTADLLDAARRASGFTWGDLISRYGGLNSNSGNRQVVLQYSPTITAQDASGVESILSADKTRLMRWIKDAISEQRFRDEVEAFA